MRATWRGHVLAESQRTVEVGGYVYFPRDAVKMDFLKLAAKTESDLECPNGVQFYDVAGKDGRSDRAAWSYEKPGPSMQKVDHYVGFWNDVTVGP